MQVPNNMYLQSHNVGGGLGGIRVDFSVRFVHSLAKQDDRIRPVRGQTGPARSFCPDYTLGRVYVP